MDKLPSYFRKKKLKSMTLEDLLVDKSILEELQNLPKISFQVPIGEYLTLTEKLAKKYPGELYLKAKYAAVLGHIASRFCPSRQSF